MAQIKIINFELAKEERPTVTGMYQLHVDFELIVSKAELMDSKKYSVQFSIGGNQNDSQKFKLLGCELPLIVSINDYTNNLSFGRTIDEQGRLHYLMHHVCKKIPSTDIEQNRSVTIIDSVFVMADLYTAENHLLLGFTGSASKKINDYKTVAQ